MEPAVFNDFRSAKLAFEMGNVLFKCSVCGGTHNSNDFLALCYDALYDKLVTTILKSGKNIVSNLNVFKIVVDDLTEVEFAFNKKTDIDFFIESKSDWLNTTNFSKTKVLINEDYYKILNEINVKTKTFVSNIALAIKFNVVLRGLEKSLSEKTRNFLFNGQLYHEPPTLWSEDWYQNDDG